MPKKEDASTGKFGNRITDLKNKVRTFFKDKFPLLIRNAYKAIRQRLYYSSEFIFAYPVLVGADGMNMVLRISGSNKSNPNMKSIKPSSKS